MDRTSGANFVTVSGKRMFTNPNLGTNTLGTQVEQLWLNGAQESLLGVVEAFGLTPTDADNTQLLKAIMGMPGKNIQIFTTSGTFTPPAGVTKVDVRGQAPGGSAGGFTTGNTNSSGCGAAGGYFEKICSVTPGVGITVTIGSPGAPVSGGTNNGNAGGSVSFGSFASATGGLGGVGGAASPSAGGLGGTATGGDINIPGGDGTDGGASSGSTAGLGGSCPLGGGGRAGTGAGGGGLAGAGYGSGGGGVYGTTAASGAGAPGIIIVRW